MEGAGSPDGSDIDANIDYLNTQVELLTAGNEKLEKDLDTISVEKVRTHPCCPRWWFLGQTLLAWDPLPPPIFDSATF